MVGLTIRNIPEEILRRIRILAAKNRRSMNSEILMVIEDGLKLRISEFSSSSTGQHFSDGNLSFATRSQIWNDLGGQWKDNRTVPEVIEEVYGLRGEGRTI
jgi:hypothetical protein